MAAYTGLKARVFENQAADDYLILNYDDEVLRDMAKDAPCRVRWFSRTAVPPRGAFVVGGSVVYGTADDNRTICVAEEIAIPGPPQPGERAGRHRHRHVHGRAAAGDPPQPAHLQRGGAPDRKGSGIGRRHLHQRFQGHQRGLHAEGHRHHDEAPPS